MEPESADVDPGTVVITTSTSGDLNDTNSKDLLERISEIDENESRPTSGVHHSRPVTGSRKLPSQMSQATLRSKHRDEDSDEGETGSQADEKDVTDPVLLTELGPELYDEPRASKAGLSDGEDSDEHDDDDDVLLTPKKVTSSVVYENDIYNEKKYDTDLDDESEEEDSPDDPKKIYKKMCDNLKVVPCRYFLANIDKQKLTMRFHQFSPDEVRAISKPLWNNFQIEKLHLDGNWIECNGAKYLSRMIRQNDFITELSLADNRLGETSEGTKEVCRMLTENCILKKLNLSGNLFHDRDAEALTVALEKNRLLKELDISHNRFGQDGGKLLGQYISANDTLEVLDLSWNNFQKKAAKEIAIGIKENVRLKRCNVSFNGFDSDAGKVLADIIKQNTTLEHLDISNTRINAECAAAIANALEQNDSLKSLNISNNPITTSGALAIIYAVKLNNSSVLEKLDMSEIPVTKDFEQVLAELVEARPHFKCYRGPVISTSNTKSILYDSSGKVDFEKILNDLKKKS